MTRDYSALIAFIDSRQGIAYEWGRDCNDCVGFVLGAVEALTGAKPVPKLAWKTEKKGLRLIADLGGLEAAFDHYFERIPPAFAMRGDIGGVPDATFGIHPMIVEGNMLVGPGDKGNRRLKRTAMTCAWSATNLKAL